MYPYSLSERVDLDVPTSWTWHCCHTPIIRTTVNLTKRDVERQCLPLPPADYLAVTVEEQPVMHGSTQPR